MEKKEKNYSPEEVLELRISKIQQRREWSRFIIELAVFAAFLYVIFSFVLGIATVSGSSMTPALRDGERLLFYRMDRQYYPGDIVIIHRDDQVEYVKRVIAVEGDTVDIDMDAGRLIINGEAAEESYIYTPTYRISDRVSFPLTVEKGQIFVLGDNRENSRDSREFGCVDISEVTGRVLFHAGIF